MGVNGCAWVLWDPGDTGGHKNKASRDKNGCSGRDLGPMAWEISPNIMFCKKTKKNVRMTPYGCKWVRMGVVGCRDTGEQENKGERGTNSRSGQYLVMHDHCKKMRKYAGMISATREDKGGECRAS